MLARAARPKLTLTVPTVTSPTIASAAPKSPFPGHSYSSASNSSHILSPSSPLTSPTARNTMLNSQRNFHAATLSPLPPPSNPAPSQKGGILKKAGCACTHPGRTAQGKKISFSKEARVNMVSPMPADYHGSYVRGSSEGRWGSVRGE